MDKLKLRNIKEKAYALNSETRIEILFLCQEKELTITQIGRKLNLSLNNTSQNVSILERAGLVKKTKNKDGTVTVKSLTKITDNGIQW